MANKNKNYNKTNIRKALLFVLCLTVTCILLGDIIVGPVGLVELVIAFLQISFFVFGVGLGLYYAYNYFKQKRKITWFFIGLFGLILGFLIITLRLEIGLFITNAFHSTKLPEKYASYQNINTEEEKSFKKYNIKLLSEGTWHKIQHFVTPKNNIILAKSYYPNNERGYLLYHKYNQQGEFLDTLRIVKNWDYEFYDGYIINNDENTYLTWAFDNDTIPKPITKSWYMEENAKYYKDYTKHDSSPAEITPRYFHKIKKGGGNSTFWQGSLFFDVVINRTDTLKLKEDFFLNEDTTQEKFTINGKGIGVLLDYHYNGYGDIYIDYDFIKTMPYEYYDFPHFKLLRKTSSGEWYIITPNKTGNQ